MSYSIANSLSPMMFRKKHKEDKGGTRNERMRSKSVESILDAPDIREFHRPSSAGGRADEAVWTEVSKVKTVHPVIACVLPSLAMDLVANALLAVGATPLITEDPEDIEKDLDICKAIVVDVSAPSVIVEAFIEKYEVGCKPLILIASECGTSDRKKNLAVQIVQESGPNAITGKLVDIYTLQSALVENANSRMGSSESDGSVDDQQPSSIPHGPIKVVLSTDKGDEDIRATSLPPALRRARMRRSTSPGGVSPTSTAPPVRKNSSPSVSPFQSPRTSPPGSTGVSPRSSPVLKKRGIQKLLARKVKAKESGPIKRVPTAPPRLRMKGQFRDTTHHNIKSEDALDSAQNLAARTNAFVNIYEMNVVTSGEVIAEITNNQLGMWNLHSTLPTCGAVVAAVLACVETCEDDDLELKHAVHAFAHYYVAAEEASVQSIGCSERGTVQPGTLRVKLIDALYYIDEPFVRSKATVDAHTEGTKSAFK